MPFDFCTASLAPFGVIPILPSTGSLLMLFGASVGGLVAGILTVRVSTFRSLFRIFWRQKWGLVSWLLIFALVSHFSRISISRTSLTYRSTLTNKWSKYRGSLNRTGHADSTPGPDQGAVIWSIATEHLFYGEPAVAGEDLVAIGCKGNTARIFCSRVSDGNILWTSAPQGYRATFASPVVSDGYLVCGEGLHSTKNAKLTCFDLLHRDGPTIIGEFITRGHIECTPVIANGKVYFGAGDDGIYCLKLPDRPARGLQEVWHVDGARYPDAETSLAVYQDRVYLGLGIGGEALCILDAHTGKELDRIAFTLPVFSPPAIANGRLYIGLGRADFANYRQSPPGEVCCLDLASGKIVWRISTSTAILSAVVATSERIYFATVGGEIVAADLSGHVLHRWSAPDAILNSPAVTDDMLYCVDCSGVLTGLDLDLRKTWNVRLGNPGEYISSPVVAQGKVLVGTPHDGLVAIGELTSPYATSLNADNRNPEYRDKIPEKVQLAWSILNPPLDESFALTTSPAVARESLFLPIVTSEKSKLVCLNLRRNPRIAWSRDIPFRAKLPPQVDGDVVYCVSGEVGHPGQLMAFDAATGAVNWKRDIHTMNGELCVNGGILFLTPGPNMLSAVDRRGVDQWHIGLEGECFSVQSQGSMLIVATVSPDHIMAFDSITGSRLWQKTLADTPVSSVRLDGSLAYVSTNTALEVRSLLNGEIVQRDSRLAKLKFLSVNRSQIVGMTEAGEIHWSLDGTTMKSCSGANPAWPPLVGLKSFIYANQSGHWMYIDLSRDRREVWYTPAMPIPFDQLVSDGNGLFFIPIRGRGLDCLKPRSLH